MSAIPCESLQKAFGSYPKESELQEPAAQRFVQEGILPLAVQELMAPSPRGLQLSCLFILNSLCRERRILTKALAVDNYSMAKSCMRILTDWTLHVRCSTDAIAFCSSVVSLEAKGNMLEELFTSVKYDCAWLDVRMISSLAIYYYQLINTTGAVRPKESSE
ncbi:hypothetical protein PoB_001593500 [Plakobranchus ocellatus]|uniref:Uncharacterized protein n=1 Tax=Plakobranchus ocellatus TaxID=259542 RepID=A0AAV3Z2P7_9GAST|nr:hypothetical protein PoB_001593500 [Plakobranchus ocellatus]